MKSRLKASPRGSCCGFVTASVGGQRLTIGILPKVWRPKGQGARALTAAAGTVHWLYELETLTIPQELEACAEALLDAADSVSKKQDDLPILALEACRSQEAKGDVYQGLTSDHEPFRELLALAVLARKCASHRPAVAHSRETNSVSTANAETAIGRGTTPDPFFDLLRRYELVTSIACRLREIRRGYVHAEDRLILPRGRPKALSIARHLASGIPELDCVFDEFTEAIPLFRVLVSALDHIASPPCLAGYGGLGIGAAVARDARELRHTLQSIGSLPRLVAVHEAARIRLDRPRRTWQHALDTARAVLADDPARLVKDANGPEGAFAWTVSMPRLWEQCLIDGLRAARPDLDVIDGNGGVGPARNWACPLPWRGDLKPGDDRRRPDILLVSRGDNTCDIIDAKYKLFGTIGQPSMADADQLFAYSHLTTVEVGGQHAKVRHCALAYPDDEGSGQPREQLRSEPQTTESMNKEPVKLHLIRAPFPRPQQLLGLGGTATAHHEAGRVVADILRPTYRILKNGAPTMNRPGFAGDPTS